MPDILDTLQSLGIDGNVRGDEYFAPCPAHKERTGSPDEHPSWSINLNEGIFYCFSCQYRGTLSVLIRDMVGEEAAKDWDIESPRIAPNVLMKRLREVRNAISVRPPTTQGFPEAALDVFMAPPEWALSIRNIEAGPAKDMGVLWDGRQDRWVLVVRDTYANIIGWQIKSEKGPKVFRNWPAGMHKGTSLFGYHFVKDYVSSDPLVVVESPLDAVRVWGLGMPAVASYGSRLSSSQLDLLKYHRVIAFPDNDAAGLQMRSQLDSSLKGVRHVDWSDFPPGADPGDLTSKDILSLVSESRSTLANKVQAAGRY